MYRDEQEQMEEDAEALVGTQEATQSTQTDSQNSQEDQQPKRSWNDHLWGFLVPCREGFPREDFWKMHPCIRIGRASGNDLIFPSLRISSRHCELRWNGDMVNPHISVSDHSSNGTFINGEKIGKDRSMFLRDGNEIGFGTWGGNVSPSEDYRYIFRIATHGQPMDGLHAHFDMGHELGKGSFATVMSAIERATGRIWAVKVIHPSKFETHSQTTMDLFLREIQILETLKHPNICMLKEVFFSETIHLVLEYVEGGDLLDYITARQGLDEGMSKYLVKQLTDALKYIHTLGIAHRDLKPENILLTKDDPPVLKVADFGLAKAVDSMTKFKTTCGTPCYIAPEVILREDQEEAYDERVDSWSVGVIIYCMLFYRTPFDDDETLEIKERFKRRIPNWGNPPAHSCSPLGYDFIIRLLAFKPEHRMTCIAACEHPWINTPGGYMGTGNIDPADMKMPPGKYYDSASQSIVSMSVVTGANDALTLFPGAVGAQNASSFGPGFSSDYLYVGANGSISSDGSQLATPVPGNSRPLPSQSQAGKSAPIVRRVQELERIDPEGHLQKLKLFSPAELGKANADQNDRKRKEPDVDAMDESDSSLTPVAEATGQDDEAEVEIPGLTGRVQPKRNVKRKANVPIVKAPGKAKRK